MAKCPLCAERAGKRYCPAKGAQICAVCCATKREIEIDCPSSCGYLLASREYEAEKRVPDADFVAKIQKYDQSFMQRFSPVLDVLGRSIAEERLESPWLVDLDVVEVYKSLRSTMNTLSSGIYYESLPEGPVRLSLFRRVRSVLDQLMQPDPQAERSVLKVSEVLEILDFLTFAAELNSGMRPKSRRYLDVLSRVAGISGPEPSSGLIIP